VKELTSLGDEWIDLLKCQSTDWVGKPLVVLSLFDGIGAIWTALSLLGIPFVGYSSEIVSCPQYHQLCRYYCRSSLKIQAINNS
jgi:hypothetical protein